MKRQYLPRLPSLLFTRGIVNLEILQCVYAYVCADLVRRHAGVLGLSACILSSPYDVPDWMPQILMDLSNHLNDPQPIEVHKNTNTHMLTHYKHVAQHVASLKNFNFIVQLRRKLCLWRYFRHEEDAQCNP